VNSELARNLNDVLSCLIPELEEKLKLREDTITASRRVTVLSKQAVMAVHQGNHEEASVKLQEAEQLLRNIEDRISSHPDVRRESANIAYQEYAEARIFEAVVLGSEFPSPQDLKIPTIQYVLGLADAIGEFRRRTVDALTRRDISEAESSLKTMEEIYRELLPLEFYYSLASELRRKVDVARHLIEATMGDVYTEKNRSSLESAMQSLENKLGTQKPSLRYLKSSSNKG
jgi:translin